MCSKIFESGLSSIYIYIYINETKKYVLGLFKTTPMYIFHSLPFSTYIISD